MISSDACVYGSGMASCGSTRQCYGRYGDPRKPHLIRHRDRAPIIINGLLETWRNHIATCTVVVTEANATIQPIHNRMPVVLADDDFAAWLDPQNNEYAGLAALLQPSAAKEWTLETISKQVSNARNEGPEPMERQGMQRRAGRQMEAMNLQIPALDSRRPPQDNSRFTCARSSAG